MYGKLELVLFYLNSFDLVGMGLIELNWLISLQCILYITKSSRPFFEKKIFPFLDQISNFISKQ